VLFIGVLPLLGSGSLRASIGCFLSVLCAAFVREASPFLRDTTNLLMVVAQYQILATFMAALILITGSLETFGLSDLGLGALLLTANSLILFLSGTWCYQRLQREREQAGWRQALSPEDQAVLEVSSNLECHELSSCSV